MQTTATSHHVLVVDDDPAVGLVLQALLTQAGYRASLARSAQAALSLLQTELTDLVLTDLRMPEMDGLTLLETLKRNWPEVPVVMLARHGAERRRGHAGGRQRFFAEAVRA
jgi:CheY-like chemotaxis protein